MVTNKSKRYFSVILTLFDFVLVLTAVVRKSSDLLEFNQTYNAALFPSSAKHLFYKYVTPSFAGHSFVLMQVKLGTFLPIYLCAF